MVVVAFAAVILLGTGLLSLPVATAGPERASLIEALFPSTSAVCVAGPIVVDTPGYWSAFGHGVILGLIQMGGFGIMTAASVLGRRGQPSEVLIQLPRSELDRLVASLQWLDGERMWGCIATTSGRVFADPVVLMDLAATPVELLAGVEFVPDDLGPPSNDLLDPFHPDHACVVLAQLRFASS